MARKAFLPGIFVVGSQPIVEKDILGQTVQVTAPKPSLFLANGQPHGQHFTRMAPAWQPGHQIGVVSHFVNEAARRRCGGNMAQAEKQHLVQVPMFRGVTARIANQLRYMSKRAKKKALLERIKTSIQETVAGATGERNNVA